MPWRVYRPAIVVGDSRTGLIDKVDGPYYLFELIRRLSVLPGWMRLPGPDLGATNVVPVDYVVDAMDHLMHVDGLDGHAFHLVNPRPQPVHKVFNAFAAAAGAPRLVPTVGKGGVDTAVGLAGRLGPHPGRRAGTRRRARPGGHPARGAAAHRVHLHVRRLRHERRARGHRDRGAGPPDLRTGAVAVLGGEPGPRSRPAAASGRQARRRGAS